MPARILITGGVSGLGHALAEIYAARGECVLVTDVAPASAVLPASAASTGSTTNVTTVSTSDSVTGSAAGSTKGLAAGLPSVTGAGEVAYLQLDVRSADAWRCARDWVEERWGGLDLLINNAGVAAGGRIDVLPIAEWERIIDINLLGVVRGCATFTPVFKRQRSGRIVNVASLAGLVHAPNMSSYNAVKAGVVALSETLLHELAAYDVDVSVVCPSFFRTNLNRSLSGSDPALEKTAHRLITQSRQSADTVAKRTVRKLDVGQFLIRPQAEAVAAHNLKRFAAPVYHRVMKRVGTQLDKRAGQRDALPTTRIRCAGLICSLPPLRVLRKLTWTGRVSSRG